MEEAAKTESKAEKTTESGAREEKDEKEEKAQGNVAESDAQMKNEENVQTAAYTHVDVRL